MKGDTMKKSSFVAMMLGTVSGVLFALGMCMALLPEWNAFTEGIIFGAVGLVLGLITIFVWRKMENKAPLKLSPKGFMVLIFSLMGALALGIGMCFCLVWESYIIGILIGLVGILLLLGLIPITKGLK